MRIEGKEKPTGLSELLQKAKSWWKIDDSFGLNDESCAKIKGCEDRKGCWVCNPECPRNKTKWVSVDDLKQWQREVWQWISKNRFEPSEATDMLEVVDAEELKKALRLVDEVEEKK